MKMTTVVPEARVYLLAAAIAAFIQIVPDLIDRFVGQRDPASIATERIDDDVETIAAPQGVPPGTFGQWRERRKDTIYQAETDGFVAAYTGGNSPADEFVIEVGERVEELRVRTRAGRYDGTISPVARSDYWTVRPFGDRSITVHWLPIGNREDADRIR